MRAATAPAAARGRARMLADAVRAEGSKLWSLPMVWLVLGGTLALTVVLSSALGANTRIDPDAPGGVLDLGVTPVTWTQCGFFLFGVVAATSEYVGGQIRTTLVAVPDRTVQRLAAFAALVPFAFVSAVATFAAGVGAMLAATGTPAGELDWPAALLNTFSASGHLTLMALLSSALGLLIRRAVPAAAALLVYLYVVSPLLQGQDLYFLPDVAAYTLWFTFVPDEAPSAPVAWFTVIAWTLAFLAASVLVARSRDT